MRFIKWFAVLFLFAHIASAQTITPLISEAKAGKSTKGQFDVINNGIVPLFVTVEPMSFSPNKSGGSATLKLDPGIQVKLDSMSAKLGAKMRRTFYWEAKCVSYPCFFAIFAGFSGLHNAEGMAVKLQLPTTVWICPEGAKNCRQRIRHDVLHLQP